MKNFEFEFEGNKYWWSRSIAVGMYVFAKDIKDNWYILINKRGPGCPSNIGKWNIPCGYLDCNETTKQAAIRECFEETGINLYNDNIIVKRSNIVDNEFNRTQNVIINYYTILDNYVEDYSYQICNTNSEKDEVDDIKFIPISEIKDYDFAFNHKNTILEHFNKYINCNFIVKFIRYLYDKFC